MKTEFMLLAMTDGRPTLNQAELGAMLSISETTVQNRCYSKAMPFPCFKAGSKWHAHVVDVAKYLDSQREGAIAEIQDLIKAGRYSAATAPVFSL